MNMIRKDLPFLTNGKSVQGHSEVNKAPLEKRETPKKRVG